MLCSLDPFAYEFSNIKPKNHIKTRMIDLNIKSLYLKK